MDPVEAPNHAGGGTHAGDIWVHVHESYVQRVEIRLERDDKPDIGFRHTEGTIEDPGAGEAGAAA